MAGAFSILRLHYQSKSIVIAFWSILISHQGRRLSWPHYVVTYENGIVPANGRSSQCCRITKAISQELLGLLTVT